MKLINILIYIALILLLSINYCMETYIQPIWNVKFVNTENMSCDIRCEPKIPKRDFVFRNSSIDYYYRPNCIRI